MDETKLNILICGLTSDSSLLFIPLYKFLKSAKHRIEFFVPEYSGAVCLIEQKITYIQLKDFGRESELDSNDKNLLKTCLDYDLKQNNLNSNPIKAIKKRQILREGRDLFKVCKRHINKDEIDLVIVWGGIRLYSNIPSAIAKKNNIKCIFIEKGLYPYTLQIDSQGVNGLGKLKEKFSSLLDLNDSNSIEFYQSLMKEKWFSSQPLDTVQIKNKLKYFFKQLSIDELFIKLYHKYFETKLLRKFLYKKNWEVTDPIRSSERINELGYIFIPFQVYDDSQLLIQDNWITDNITLVKSVIKSLQDLEIKRKIIIKEHPREFRKIDYKKILKDNDICFSTAGTIDLISESKLIVTINSTVGFEALVFCKPVLITGSALYESLPYITKVNNQADLTLNIEKYICSEYNFDKIEINRSVSSVYNKLVQCNYVSPSGVEINNLWQKILELITVKG